MAEANSSSWTSSTVDLRVDGSAGQLGHPKLIDETTRRVLSQDTFNWGTRVDVVGCFQGCYNGKKAVLVIFNFHFLFEPGTNSINRLSWAKITLKFRAKAPEANGDDAASNIPSPRTLWPKRIAGALEALSRLSQAKITPTPRAQAPGANRDGDTFNIPILRDLCPKLIEGPVEIKEHTSLGEIDAPRLGIRLSSSVKYVRKYRMQIEGMPCSDTDVVWHLTENKAQEDGIPSDFRTAVILEHHGNPVQGDIKIQARTASGIRLFGWPWSESCPIVFNPTVTFGDPPGETDFAKLSEEDWAQICKFPHAMAVSLLRKQVPRRGSYDYANAGLL
jgi:hypothetical protein